MIIHSIENKIAKKKWKDKNGIEWNLMSLDEVDKKTGGKVILFGDVGKKHKNKIDVLVNDSEDQLEIYKTREKISFFEKVYGYIECIDTSNETLGFLRIIKVSKIRVLGILLMFLLLFLSIIFFINRESTSPELDKAAIAYTLPESSKNTDPNMIAMPGISEVIYKKGINKVITPLINPEGNECYFIYKLILRETNEIIYESKNLKPGMALIDFDIYKNLEVGEYEISVLAEATSLINPKEAYNAGQINAMLKVVE